MAAVCDSDQMEKVIQWVGFGAGTVSEKILPTVKENITQDCNV